MTPEPTEPTQKPVTVRLTLDDIEAWRRITKRRYPKDSKRMNQVLRELIREEDERGGQGK